jgi:hypothetical protein
VVNLPTTKTLKGALSGGFASHTVQSVILAYSLACQTVVAMTLRPIASNGN